MAVVSADIQRGACTSWWRSVARDSGHRLSRGTVKKILAKLVFSTVMVSEKRVEGSEQIKRASERFEGASSWLTYEIIHWYPNWFVTAITVAAIGVRFMGSTAFSVDFYESTLFYLLLWYTSIHGLLAWRKSGLLRRNRGLVTEQVNISRPGVSKDAWNEVAFELNALFYREGIWHTPYFLFDGETWLAEFRRHFLGPNCKNVSSKDLEKDIERQIVADYKESVRESFHDSLAQEPVQVSSEFSRLPRDLLRSKLPLHRRVFRSLGVLPIIATLVVIVHSFSLDPTSFRCVFEFTLVLQGYAAFLFMHYYLFKRRKFDKLNVADRTRILADIMRAKPSDDDVEAWDTLAKTANQWLRAQGTWQTSEELFIDGKDYKSFFFNIIKRDEQNTERYFSLTSTLFEIQPLAKEVRDALAAQIDADSS